MNIENIDKTIAIMERAKERDSVDMRDWQTNQDGNSVSIDAVHTEEDLHSCGNKACLAGHIAISPEWKEFGGLFSGGYPITYESQTPDKAISGWWGLPNDIVDSFIYGDDHIYPVSWEDVKAKHVIEKLQELKTLGEEAFASKYNIDIS